MGKYRILKNKGYLIHDWNTDETLFSIRVSNNNIEVLPLAKGLTVKIVSPKDIDKALAVIQILSKLPVFASKDQSFKESLLILDERGKVIG